MLAVAQILIDMQISWPGERIRERKRGEKKENKGKVKREVEVVTGWKAIAGSSGLQVLQTKQLLLDLRWCPLFIISCQTEIMKGFLHNAVTDVQTKKVPLRIATETRRKATTLLLLKLKHSEMPSTERKSSGADTLPSTHSEVGGEVFLKAQCFIFFLFATQLESVPHFLSPLRPFFIIIKNVSLSVFRSSAQILSNKTPMQICINEVLRKLLTMTVSEITKRKKKEKEQKPKTYRTFQNGNASVHFVYIALPGLPPPKSSWALLPLRRSYSWGSLLCFHRCWSFRLVKKTQEQGCVSQGATVS